MATPTIVFNSATGSDTQASGAGPATAWYGTTEVTISADFVKAFWFGSNPHVDNAAVWDGIATDGSAVFWSNPASGRMYSRITGKGSYAAAASLATAAISSGTAVISNVGEAEAAGFVVGATVEVPGAGAAGAALYAVVTVVDTGSGGSLTLDTNASTTVSGVTVRQGSYLVLSEGVGTSGANWAIGGKRRTLDDAGSRKLGADAQAGWTIELEDGQTLTSGFSISALAGTVGEIRVRGSAEGVQVTQTGNTYHFSNSGATRWVFENLVFRNTNGTKTSAVGFLANGNEFHFVRCVFGDAAAPLGKGVLRNASTPVIVLWDCEFTNTVDRAVDLGGGGSLYAFGVRVRAAGGAGVRLAAGAYAVISDSVISGGADAGLSTAGAMVHLEVVRSTIHGNAGDGMDLSVAVVTNLVVHSCSITGNGGYGIKAHADQASWQDKVDFNNYGTGATANTSGAYSGVSAGAHDLTVDPQYTDAASGDFRVGTSLKAKGFPDATRKLGANPTSGTVSYVDIGAAQRQESGSGVPRFIDGGLPAFRHL